MELQKNRCEQVEEQLEMDPFTNDDFQRISQELLNDDTNAHRIIRDARDEIHERYKLLFAKNPEKAQLTEFLLLNKITKSAFSAITYGDVLHISRDILATQDGFEPFISPMSSTYFDDCTSGAVIDNYLYYRELTYKKSAGKHLNAAALFLGRVSYDTTNSMNEPTHPHYNAGQLAYALDSDSFTLKCSDRKDILAREDIFTYWPDATMKDNVKVSLDLLLHLWLSGSRHIQRPLTKEEFGPFYLQHIELLSRASTIKSDLHAKLHGKSPVTNFYNYENKELDINQIAPNIPTLFIPSDTPGQLTYAHPSLSRSPWPKAGSCPATTGLTLPDPDKQTAANDFFNYFSTRFGIEVPRTIYAAEAQNSTYSRTNAVLLLTFLFAEHTVLNNLPTQPRTFPTMHGTF